MLYKKFKEIMNRHIFENERKNLLEKIAENPERFVGIYRVTAPIPKIQQFLSQSREIRFGDGMEEIIQNILSEMGFINERNKKISCSDTGEILDIDQYFSDRFGNYYFVEQKIRDDHDSTKKRGQMDNFKKKYEVLKKKHKNIKGIMYFIDPCLTKNKNYYIEKLNDFPEGTVYLTYGEEFFSGNKNLFYELEANLKRWRSEINTEMYLNFDDDPDGTFEEIKNLNKSTWKKLITNDALWKEGIIQALFPNGETLKKIYHYFKLSREENLAFELRNKLRKYYPL